MRHAAGQSSGPGLSAAASAPLIRLCREEDLPLLEWFGAFTHHRLIINEAFALQRAGQVVMLVADRNGFPVAQAWLDLRLRRDRHGPTVWAVRVIDGLQGLGIGAQLMAETEEIARQKGYGLLELAVDKGNASALRFYERLGWHLVGDRVDSYSYVTPDGVRERIPLNEWVLAKDL
ncbi:MAG: acetyltransferase, family [Gammaproteobacteria bacterium]|nr:acetyltransferase, family [Gammaproteobacteria bacterium]